MDTEHEIGRVDTRSIVVRLRASFIIGGGDKLDSGLWSAIAVELPEQAGKRQGSNSTKNEAARSVAPCRLVVTPLRLISYGCSPFQSPGAR